MVVSKLGGIAPKAAVGSPIGAEVERLAAKAASSWDSFAPSEALESTWEIIRATNSYLEANEPWKMEESDELKEILGSALEVLRIVSILAYPAIPTTANAVWKRINMEGELVDHNIADSLSWGQYQGGSLLEKREPLFPRLSLEN